MKTRNGFVSNSSSSSFIIVVNDTTECPHCHRRDLDIINFIEEISKNQNDWEETKVISKTANDLIEFATDNFGFSYLDEKSKNKYAVMFDEVTRSEQEGKRVAYIQISYHDEAVNTLYHQQLDSGKIKQLWSDH